MCLLVTWSPLHPFQCLGSGLIYVHCSHFSATQAHTQTSKTNFSKLEFYMKMVSFGNFINKCYLNGSDN